MLFMLLLLTKKRAGASLAAGCLPAGGGPGLFLACWHAGFSQTVLAWSVARCTMGAWGTQEGCFSEDLT